jgi:hypothetical protein
VERHVERLLSAAAIDDCGRSNHLGSRRPRDFNRLPRRSSGGHDVFDDKHLLAGREGESSTQSQRALLALGKDRAHAEGTPDFVSDNDAAESRREDNLRPEAAYVPGKERTAPFGLLRVLEDERTLQVAGAVEPRCQAEMALEEGADPSEQVQDCFGIRCGHRNVTSRI